MTNISDLINLLHANHKNGNNLCEIQGKPATPENVAAWKKNTKFDLPLNYEQFLLQVGSCKLHIQPELASRGLFFFFGLQSVNPVLSDCDDMPQSWYSVADIYDGNYIVMDLSSCSENRVDIIDGFHETLPYEATIIAHSFTEFLFRAMEDPNFSTGGGNGRQFWSKFACYGDKGMHELWRVVKNKPKIRSLWPSPFLSVSSVLSRYAVSQFFF